MSNGQLLNQNKPIKSSNKTKTERIIIRQTKLENQATIRNKMIKINHNISKEPKFRSMTILQFEQWRKQRPSTFLKLTPNTLDKKEKILDKYYRCQDFDILKIFMTKNYQYQYGRKVSSQVFLNRFLSPPTIEGC